MLHHIVEFSLRLRYLVVVIAGALIFFGILRLRDAPIDVFPEFAPPYVEIQTEALGLSAAEVESLITLPMEEILHGVSWLQTMRSESIPGLSSIVLIFEPGTDLMRARALVQERLTQAQGLPTKNVSKPPTMLQPLSSTSRVMMIGLTSQELSPIEMSVLARWTIRPRLMGIPGVANVAIWGQRERQLQVQVSPEQLHAHGVSLKQIIRTVGDALWVSPLSFLEASTPGVSGGFVDTPNQRLGVMHLLPISSAEDLAQVTVADTALRLGEVSDVVEDHQPLIGDAVVNGGPGLLLVVEKFPNANTLELTKGIDQAFVELGPGLKGITVDSSLFRPATYINLAVDNLFLSLLIGFLLVLLALFIFTTNWRVVIVALIVIPLSLLMVGLVLYWRGETINTMVLAGFAIALVVIIDDLVIDVDNTLRRLRQPIQESKRPEDSEQGSAKMILEALSETRHAMLFATLIIVLAVSPVFFIEGIAGAFFQPFALSYTLALVASMLVALTATPALLFLLFSSSLPAQRDPALMRGLHYLYERLLAPILRTPSHAYFITAILLLLGIGLFPLLNQSLLPVLRESNILIRWSGAPGASHPAMNRLATLTGNDLRSIPGVQNFGAHIGRAITGDQIVGVNESELWLNIDPMVDLDTTVAAIQQTVAGYPGMTQQVVGYLQDRVRTVLTGSDDAIVVRVYGVQLDVLRQKAEEIKTALAGISGLVDLQVKNQTLEPTVEIEADIGKAAAYGLKPGDVRRAAATLINGLEVGNLFEEQKVFEVMVVGAPALRQNLTTLSELLIDTGNVGTGTGGTGTGGTGIGGTGIEKQVRLKDVANIKIVAAPNMIQREGVSRYVDVSANVDTSVSGRSLSAVASEVEARLQTIDFPLEYHAALLGEYAEQRAAQQRLLSLALAALIGIFLLLQASFNSWRMATLTFLALPSAFVGGLLATYFTGGLLSLGSLVGFLAVLGIAARNSILLVSHFQRLEIALHAFGPEIVRRGAGERLSATLLTAVATGVALLPLILLGNIPGHEIVRPMAIVILGGLSTSTLLNLFIVPALYLRFGQISQTDVLDLGSFAPAMSAD